MCNRLPIQVKVIVVFRHGRPDGFFLRAVPPLLLNIQHATFDHGPELTLEKAGDRQICDGAGLARFSFLARDTPLQSSYFRLRSATARRVRLPVGSPLEVLMGDPFMINDIYKPDPAAIYSK